MLEIGVLCIFSINNRENKQKTIKFNDTSISKPVYSRIIYLSPSNCSMAYMGKHRMESPWKNSIPTRGEYSCIIILAIF